MAEDEPIGVLVVDESEAFLAGTLRWLESRMDACLIGTARNAEEALEKVERLEPGLVIIEAVLKGTDGFRLARAIKEKENAPLVLLVTFHASAAARDEAYAAGADGFLAKYDFSDGLDALLREWQGERPERPVSLRTPAKPARRGWRNVPDP